MGRLGGRFGCGEIGIELIKLGLPARSRISVPAVAVRLSFRSETVRGVWQESGVWSMFDLADFHDASGFLQAAPTAGALRNAHRSWLSFC